MPRILRWNTVVLPLRAAVSYFSIQMLASADLMLLRSMLKPGCWLLLAHVSSLPHGAQRIYGLPCCSSWMWKGIWKGIGHVLHLIMCVAHAVLAVRMSFCPNH
jgi:hypothetical protein